LGYYLLGFTNNEIQIILNPKEELVELVFATDRLKDSVIISASLENKLLWSFKYFSRDTQARIKSFESSPESNTIVKALADEKDDFKDGLLTSFPESYFSKVIKSFQRTGYASKAQEKTHFFDNINFGDPSLVRSSLFPSKVLQYFQHYTDYDETGFKNSIDLVLEKSKANQQVFNFNLNFLLQLFEEIGPDVVYEYIINDYVLADGCFDENISDHLTSSISEYEKLLVGKTAPDVRLSDEMTLLNAICEAKYTVLFFWSSQCQFCHDQLPVLKQLDVDFHDTVDILALSLDTDYQQWQNAIEREGLPWAHYSDLKGWDAEYVSQFKISKTPSYYLVDSNGTIIAKPADAKILKVLLEKL